MKRIVAQFVLATVSLLCVSGNLLAACNLERFRFGASYEELEQKIEFHPMLEPIESPLPTTSQPSMQIIFVPGEALCTQEKAFEGAPIHFYFLYDKLVQIEINRLASQPVLAAWAESVYGIKQDKPHSFSASEPNAQWFWETSSSVILYSITTNQGDTVESIQIQSKHHQSLFEKWAAEEESQ